MVQSALPDPESRLRRYLRLGDDIRNLGGEHAEVQNGSLFQSAEPSFTRSLGTLYVIEGSVHGGQLIRRSLESHLPKIDPMTVQFLGGFGDETAAHWRRFCQWLAEQSLSTDQAEEACKAASETFSIFTDFLLNESPRS